LVYKKKFKKIYKKNYREMGSGEPRTLADARLPETLARALAGLAEPEPAAARHAQHLLAHGDGRRADGVARKDARRLARRVAPHEEDVPLGRPGLDPGGDARVLEAAHGHTGRGEQPRDRRGGLPRDGGRQFPEHQIKGTKIIL
jgi:hypothetical protein